MNCNVEHVMNVTDRPSVVMVKGSGSWLWDDDGRKYLDFVQGWAVNCLGHAPSIIADTLHRQAGRLINCSPAYYNEPMARLASLLAEGTHLRDVFLCNSGAEANEGAIKLARKWGARHRGGAFEIITFHGGFHGRTLATMAASGKPAWETLFEPKVPGFRKVPLGDLDAVNKAVTAATVAVMLEPIQGEAGVFVADDAWLRDLRRLTLERDLLLILDEIQTGSDARGTYSATNMPGSIPTSSPWARVLAEAYRLPPSWRPNAQAVSIPVTRGARSMAMPSWPPSAAPSWKP
jgi:acetylornithine/N-succinyldiaminopimelate aminotransferase